MATDVAEVIGGAVALWLLFGVPLLWGGVITGSVSIALLLIQARRGARSFEFVVIGLMLIITIGFTYGVFASPPDPGGVVAGLVPRFEGTGSVLLAASILGATIMPHAIYAHSALARDRFTAPTAAASDRGIATRRLLRATRWDVTIALAIAGTVNLCILLLAASRARGRARHRQPRGRARRAERGDQPCRRDAVRGRPAGERPGQHGRRRVRGRRDHARPPPGAHPACSPVGSSPWCRRS